MYTYNHCVFLVIRGIGHYGGGLYGGGQYGGGRYGGGRYGGGCYGRAFQFRVDATPDTHKLPWPLRRNPNPNPNQTLTRTLTLTLTLSTLTITPTCRSVHGNVSIWWLRRSAHPKLKSSA